MAQSLDIHPFMLSRWRKEARDGIIVTKGIKLNVNEVCELRRLRQLEKEHA
ncbi:hypothetical protein D3878_03245 [Noviherbaspirillum sedimenti]|uniref:Transposase n=1 Tax=Noviherbaspirillum sedimenti TaxID=2320865 RepID=A0A3A3G1D1_9BURK|nr:hypothetical protein D3878_03245 [Noviherbaspirillum sedimenti]